MGGSVLTDDTTAVDGENHMQRLEADVMQNLIICALQKGRVNGNHWLQVFSGQASGKGDPVLFRNSHIKKSFRKQL